MASARYVCRAALLVLPLLATSCGSVAPDSVSAQPVVPPVANCNVGGKPRKSVGYRAHRQVILGCGRTSPGGSFKLIGSRDRGEGLCLTVQRRGEGEGSTVCQGGAPPPGPPRNRDLALEGGTGGQRGYTMTGYVSERVTAVRFSLSHRGKRETVPANVIAVRGRVLTEFGAPEPFGYVVVGLPAGAQGIDAVALDAGGQVVDRQEVGSLPSSDGSSIFSM